MQKIKSQIMKFMHGPSTIAVKGAKIKFASDILGKIFMLDLYHI